MECVCYARFQMILVSSRQQHETHKTCICFLDMNKFIFINIKLKCCLSKWQVWHYICLKFFRFIFRRFGNIQIHRSESDKPTKSLSSGRKVLLK